ncbi:MAG: M48 family metalloprotease [Syntrophales bacterium LBB04]|nr:M48 family metalloprotease [Syntrophales bacterium LBB04]
MRIHLLAIALFCSLAACATSALPPVSINQPLMLEEDEKRVWLRSQEEEKVLLKSGFVYQDIELERYVNRVARKLRPEQIFSQIPFKVVVLSECHLNAFALPTGTLFIHTGILARMENEAQLAMLLAHEMTHSTHRHAASRLRDLKNKAAFAATIQAVGGLAGVIGSIGTMASVAGYSQQLETEADLEGLKAVEEAGYDLAEAKKLFVILKTEVEEEKLKEPFFFGSHPRLQERIDNCEAFVQQQNKISGGIRNELVFVEHITPLILDNARLDLRGGRYKSAERGALRYIALRPADAHGHYALGEVYMQRLEGDDLDKASKQFEEALTLDALYAEPNRAMALLHYKKGEKVEAKRLFIRYLSLAEGASDRAYVEAYIKECDKGGTP